MHRLLLVPFALAIVSAAPARLQVAEGPPPEEVSAAIRPALSDRIYRVSLEEPLTAEFWFRRELPMTESASAGLGVNFGVFRRGVVLGVVRFSSSWKDYKNTEVKAGVYALRYAAQPADGDHTGVSLYRDFLLLVPAGLDQELDGSYSELELVQMSREASPSTHPSVMGMFPLWEEPEEEGVIRNEMDQPTLVVKSEAVSFGLVLDGHGEIEGY